jgi:tRNA(His) guanylyltransferase
MSNKLNDRIASYQEAADYKLLPKVPLIICINGRGFSKLTALVDKPQCNKLTECLLSTMMRLCTEIDGAMFAYQHNDEIVVLVRNDQTLETNPWYDNKLQKICSVTSSIATLHFNNCANTVDLNLSGEPVFVSQVFAVPNIMEAINTMVYKQQHNFYTSIQFACFYELLKKYNKDTIKEMLNGLSVDEKIDLLHQECNVDFNQYPTSFRRGSACYKIQKIINGVMKNKWAVNDELPIFTKDQSFLSNILKNGVDIFRG